MGLILLGVNHKSAPVEVREKLAVPSQDLPALLAALSSAARLPECFVLSTCNRVEVLAHTPGQTMLAGANGHEGPGGAAVAAAVAGVEKFLTGQFGLDPAELERHCYRLGEREAVSHLFRVASGLDSMVVGEPQILGQVKAAYAAARTAGTLGSDLDSLLQRAFAVAKRVRTETGIARSAVSVAYAAVEMACQIFGELEGHPILLLGVGKMSQLAAQHLVKHGASPVMVATRHLTHAVEMAERIGGTPIDFQEVHQALARVDIVIASTAAPHAVIGREQVEHVMRARRNRSLFIIDIAVPRDVEPEVNEIENVYLYDIDDLQAVVDANRDNRQLEAQQAEAIIQQECEAFLKRRRGAATGPTIAALLRRGEEIRSAEFQRLRGRLGPLTPRQEDQIEALTRALLNKILHRPIQAIRRAVEERGDLEALDFARRLFELPDEAAEPPSAPEQPSDATVERQQAAVDQPDRAKRPAAGKTPEGG